MGKKSSEKNVLNTNSLYDSIKESMDDVVDIKVFLDNPDAILPAYAHDGDIGMDITATAVEYNKERDSYIYHTGIHMESGRGIGCFLFPRSSNTKTDAYLPNSVGVVDSLLYRGELCFIFKNRTEMDVVAGFYALTKYLELPFWKKWRTNYKKMWIEAVDDLVKDPLKFAPYEVGDRIGQMVIFRHPQVRIQQVEKLEDLSTTVRGEGGFGSTGK